MKQKELQIQMEEMLDVLDSCGYSSESVKKYSSAISRFISYISTNELDADGDSVERFIEYSYSIRKHNNPKYFISHMRGTLLAFIFFLENGYLRVGRPSNNPKISGGLATDINNFLDDELSKKFKLNLLTINDYKNSLKLFNDYLKDNDIRTLTPDTIYGFFKLAGSGKKTSSNNLMYKYKVHLRRFINYLLLLGKIDEEIVSSIPDIKYIRNKELPSVFTSDEIKRIVDSIDRNSAVGKRAYAMIMLSVKYGLRAADVTNIKFENIDWENRIIRISQNKTKRIIELPLLPEVGNAILDYLKNARRQSNLPFIFLNINGPIHPITSSAFYGILNKYINKSRIEKLNKRHHGPHSLRHTLASQMLKNGEELTTISATLGHSSTQVTTVYLSIDYLRLKECCIPMPKLHSPHYSLED
ncbi:MAG: tyrosine-type recombinase/integrase [Catenibacterium mitsuokai]|nr:tyrosine-type recombinase/integrase [Catenibacterium mitsuokai]MEE0335654.1 tyrosine-type recombinase/integrase [Catenibacterium mitsuokai]